MKRVSFSAVAGNKKLKEMNYFSKGITMTICVQFRPRDIKFSLV